MILIEERIARKVPGQYSLFVQFKYNPDIVAKVKLCDAATFDKKTLTWEIPISEITLLLDSLVEFDDIELNILPDWFVEIE